MQCHSFRATHNISSHAFPKHVLCMNQITSIFSILSKLSVRVEMKSIRRDTFLPIWSNQSLTWWKKTMQRSMIYLHFQPSIIWENFITCIYYITLKFLSQSLPEATIFCPFLNFTLPAKNYNGFTCAQTQLDNLINITDYDWFMHDKKLA